MRQEDYAKFSILPGTTNPMIIEGDRYISLRSLTDVTVSFDEKNLTLVIMAPIAANPHVLDFSPQPAQRSQAYYPRDTSGFLNYGITYTDVGNSDSHTGSYTATEKLGLRSGDVLFLTDSQYTKTNESDDFVRLMTSITYERRDDLQRFVIGDMFASSGELGSTINIGGFGFSKVYQMDPYFIKQPTFGMSGVAAGVSQVEVYVDGLLVNRQTVQPGEFELKNLNYYGGDRNVEVVIRDPYGNIRRISSLAYFSDLLLKKSLHEYSYNVGFLREQYGYQDSQYGSAAFSAFHRYGVSNNFNIGFSAEGTRGLTDLGFQAAALFPQFGVFTASLAGSTGDAGFGSAASLAHTFQRGNFGSNILIREFSREYLTISTRDDDDRPRHEASVTLNFSGKDYGSLSLGFSETKQYSGSDSRVRSATYSKNLTNNLVLLLTGQVVSDADSNNRFDFVLTFNFTFDRDRLATAQYQDTAEGTSQSVQIQKNVPVGEGYGYRATVERTDSGSAATETVNPFFQYNGRYGVYSIDSSLMRQDSYYSQSTSATVAGSIVMAGGFTGFSRPVSDSFGLVMVDELKDVKVTLNNQDMGRTNGSGLLVVPNLSSYQFNQVAVDASDISMDYSLSEVNSIVSPGQWSGSCISFNANRVRSVTGMLFIAREGKRVPAEFGEIVLNVNGREVRVPTGKGGEFFLENLLPPEQTADTVDSRSCRAVALRKHAKSSFAAGSYPARIDYLGATCSFALTFPDTEDPISDLGEIICVPPASSQADPGADHGSEGDRPEIPKPLNDYNAAGAPTADPAGKEVAHLSQETSPPPTAAVPQSQPSSPSTPKQADKQDTTQKTKADTTSKVHGTGSVKLAALNVYGWKSESSVETNPFATINGILLFLFRSRNSL